MAVLATSAVHTVAELIVVCRVGERARWATDGHICAQWAVVPHWAYVLVRHAAGVVAVVALGTVACAQQKHVKTDVTK